MQNANFVPALALQVFQCYFPISLPCQSRLLKKKFK